MKNICFLVLLLSLSTFAQDIVLVRNGIPEAEIVLGKKPSRAAQMAAFELVHVIRLITGAELPIAAEGGGKMLPIRIGNAEKGEFKGEEYLVSVSSEGIRLAGHDTEDCGKVDYRNYKTFPGVSYHYETPRQIYNYHSTLYAVYDFLEILCGVRFYSFGDLGIACAKRKTLAVRALERRYEPKTDAFRYAGFVFRDGKGNPLRDQRLLQLRWRMNTLFGQVNHMTDSLIWRYWGPAKGYEKVFIEKRPEYFTQGYDPMPPGDSRTLYPADNPPPPQICTSHPDVARYFAREAFEVLKGKAFATPPLEGVRFRFMKKMEGKPFYYPVQEGDNSYWCKCENCRKLFPQFKGARHHAYLHFDFVNRVAREAGKLDPELHIATLAYNMALEYPDPRILRLDPGIAVQLCLGIHSWMHPSVYRRQHGEYLKWVRNERDKRPLFVWTYILSPESEAYKSYRYYNFFPVRFPWKCAEIFKEFMKDGIRGVFLELSGRYNLLEGYIAMRTAFDPDYDTDALISEYFRLYYGEAAEPMQAFFRENEKIVWNSGNYPRKEVDAILRRYPWSSGVMGIHTQSVNWSLGTPERMKLLQGYLDEAERKVRDPSAGKRLALFRKEIWEPALKGRRAYERVLQFRNLPLPSCTAAVYRPDEDINWESVRTLLPWTNLKTGAVLSAEETPQFKIACRGNTLLIRCRENGDHAFRNRKAPLSGQNVEIFFGEAPVYPFHHLILGGNGETEYYFHTMRDGVAMLERRKAEGMKFRSHTAPDGWTWTLELPLGSFSLEKLSRLRMNFIRNYGETKSSAAWSYLGPVNYAAGIDRMGYVNLHSERPEEILPVNGNFSGTDAKGNVPGWTQNMPRADKGKFHSVSDGKVKLGCPFSDVHLMAPVFPVAHGEKIVFELTASGRGEGGVGLYLYTIYNSRQNWRWHTAQTIPFRVKNGGPERIRIEVDTGKLEDRFRDIVGCRPVLMSRKGSEISISDVKIIRKPAGKKGE